MQPLPRGPLPRGPFPGSDLLGGKPRLLAWLAAFACTLLWHALLPTRYANDAAAWLEGPLPAIAGAALGLWVHRRSAGWLAALGAAGFAFLGMIADRLTLGVLLFGPLKALRAVWSLLLSVVPLPLFLLSKVWGQPPFVWVCWKAGETLLSWAALAYAVALITRPQARAMLLWWWRDLTQSWQFRRAQRQRLREYRHLYLQALRQGEAPPAPPPGLLPGMAGGWADQAQGLFWLVRIGVVLVGGISFWAVFGDYVIALLQRLSAPLPWWLGFGR